MAKSYGWMLVGASLAFGASTSSAYANELLHPPINVAVTFSVLGDLVQRVAGDDAEVTVLTPINAEVHEWELTPDNFTMMLIPEGFAHGFQALEENSSLLYMVSKPYCAAAERGLRFDDPALGIDWPLPPVGVSPRDLVHPLLKS